MATIRSHDEIRPPRGRRRRRINIFVGVFLTFQLIVPLTYYARADPYDERFAWRMFSGIRLHRCDTRAFESVQRDDGTENERRIDLSNVIHQAWIKLLMRNRRDVIHSFLERRCEEPNVVQSRVVNRCVQPDGERVPPLEYVRDCETGNVEEPRELP